VPVLQTPARILELGDGGVHADPLDVVAPRSKYMRMIRVVIE
jgi:hypothetical protein